MWISIATMGLEAAANSVKERQKWWASLSEDERKAYNEHQRKLELARASRCTLWSFLGFR